MYVYTTKNNEKLTVFVTTREIDGCVCLSLVQMHDILLALPGCKVRVWLWE